MKYGHGVSIFTFATSTSPQTWPCPLACWTYNDECMGVERKGAEQPDKPDMGRRGFVKKAAILTAVGLTGAGALGAVGLRARRHYEALVTEENIDKQNTHRCTALVINKIKKPGNVALTAAEIAYGAYAGYTISGMSGALMMGGAGLNVALMNGDSNYYLVLKIKIDNKEPIKIDEKELIVEPVTSFDYGNTKIGGEISAGCVIDDKTGKIKRIVLNPKE